MFIRPVPTQGIMFLLLALLLLGCGDLTDAYTEATFEGGSTRPTVVSGSGHHHLPHGKAIGPFGSNHPLIPEGEEDGEETPVFTFNTTVLVENIKPVEGPKPEIPITIPLPACHDVTGVHQGNLYIYDVEELENASTYAEIHGDLIIPGSVVTETIELPCLRIITGALFKPGCNSTPLLKKMSFPRLESANSVEIWATQALEELHLPALTSVGTFRVEYNYLLSKLILTSLEEVSGYLSVINGELETLFLPKLVSVGGSFTLGENPNLHTLSIPNLTSAGVFALKGLEALETLSMPSIEILKTLHLSKLHALESFSIPTLQELDSLNLFSNASLKSFHLPEIEEMEGSFKVHFNDTLPTLQMPQLTSVEQLSVHSNAALQSIHLPSLESALDIEVMSKAGYPWMPVRWISLPALKTLGWDLRIERLLELEVVYIPKLEEAYDVTLIETATLEDFHLPALEKVTGEMEVIANESLVSLRVPSLLTVGNFRVREGWWTLENVELPMLQEVGGNLVFKNNHVIEANPFTALGFVNNSVIMIDNFSLPQCSVEALLETLLAADDHHISVTNTAGNLEGCVCDGWGDVIDGSCS